MIVGIVNELYEGLGPILFYVVLASVLLHVIALVRKSRFFSSTRERYRVRSIFFKRSEILLTIIDKTHTDVLGMEICR